MTHTQQAAAEPHVAAVCEQIFMTVRVKEHAKKRGGWEWKEGWDGYLAKEMEGRVEKKVATHTHMLLTDCSSCLEEEVALTQLDADWPIGLLGGLKNQSEASCSTKEVSEDGAAE